MSSSISVALAQLDLMVGDVAGNTDRILEYAARARDRLRADIILFPELGVCGYPPEDLLFHSSMRQRVEDAVERIKQSSKGIAILVGFPEYADDVIYNSCAVFRDGEKLAHYRKHLLPNYQVFDEKRYFTPGKEAAVFKLNGIRCGMNICEDVWHKAPIAASRSAGAEVVFVINGSPYDAGSQKKREQVVKDRVQEVGVPMVYLNMVGGQDELVFDGGSFVMDGAGEVVFRGAAFDEGLYQVELRGEAHGVVPVSDEIMPSLPLVESVYKALVTGTRDYINKHEFPGIVIGLSGGIDSALVTALAVDALGADRVRTVMMPFRYTSTISQEDAAAEARALGIRYDVISIEPMYEATLKQLKSVFEGRPADVSEENIQARCRGLLLMAISNKTGRMVLTTGNKSEMAVGYATLYGDMAGGFAPINDCSKSLVYKLARYRNSISAVIPERTITRAPSAELRPQQKDSDALPDYDVLDPILEAFIEHNLSVAEIVDKGFERETVEHILELVKRNEYKRRQAPPGIRISNRAFGRDWRYPITSRYRFPG